MVSGAGESARAGVAQRVVADAAVNASSTARQRFSRIPTPLPVRAPATVRLPGAHQNSILAGGWAWGQNGRERTPRPRDLVRRAQPTGHRWCPVRALRTG